MDTFDNIPFPGEAEEPRPAEEQPQEPIPAPEAPQQPAPAPEAPQQPAPSTYSGVGAGRKESPYANSPYVTNPRPQPEYHYQPQTQPPQKPPKEKKASNGTGKRVLAVLLVLAILGGICGGFAWVSYDLQKTNRALTQQITDLNSRIRELENHPAAPAAPGSSGPSRPVSDGSLLTPAQLYESCVDSVVAISSTVSAWGYRGLTEGSSSGSGFILSSEGYVVTNYHVVENATSISVTLHDGTKYPAEAVGHDISNDIAVLKLTEEAENLKPAAIGHSSALSIGDMVVAIGNPLGELASTQTVGYISGINREVTTDNTVISMLQTDAAINPGNSGGPLFNMQGEVIGITTAKYSGTTGSGASIEGIGFAIPIDDIYSMFTDLIDFGYVTGAYLGVTVRNMDPESVEMYGLPLGAYVLSIVDGASADRAGVRPKDIITRLGDYPVTSVNELTRNLRNFKAGDETTVTIVRGGQEKVLTITLDEKPKDLNAPVQDSAEMPSDGNYDEWYEYFRPFFGG